MALRSSRVREGGRGGYTDSAPGGTLPIWFLMKALGVN